jgi:hypothetical protein
MNGAGISVASSGSDKEIVGFYATRWVKAENVEAAKKTAISLVLRDWTDGEYAGLNKANLPTITVDTASKVSFVRYLWHRPGHGHAFYSSDG